MTKLLSRPPVVEPAMTIDDVIALIKKVLNHERYNDPNYSLFIAKGCVTTLIKQGKVDAYALHYYDESERELEIYIRFLPDGQVERQKFKY